jgi:YaiO family outer membrane protein
VYKKFKSKDYLYLTSGVSSSSIFHNFHISGEYFNSFKSTWEHSYGLKFTQFSDSLFSIIGTTSISKYNGRFLTIIRSNVGYQNSSVINTLNVNIKQRYYNSDDSSSDLTIGYGYNSNLILFENNDNIQLTENRTFVVGLNTFQKLSKRWYLNSNYSFQWFDFGNVERNQYSYSLSIYYTW